MAYTTINKGSSYFNTVTYTGTGATNTLTGVGFQPDWVWIKQRSSTTWHNLYDVVRGTTKALASNDTSAEDTRATGLTAFTSDGFTLGTDNNANGSSNTYVAWNWLGSNTTTSNTVGSITSTVSANTTAGFSIVGWTGTGATATVGHGLGTTPKMFIVRERSEARNWPVLTTVIDGSWDTAYLNNTDAFGNAVQSASSTVFNFTSSNEFNASGQTYIAYCFADIKGYSKIGFYTGNGSSDGTFVYTGFKPAWVMVKRTNSAVNSWRIWDKVRSPSNVVDKFLYPNLSNDEAVDVTIDFLSNGFKFRNTSTDNNASGGTYIYMAFAENPFVTSGGIPVTAR